MFLINYICYNLVMKKSMLVIIVLTIFCQILSLIGYFYHEKNKEASTINTTIDVYMSNQDINENTTITKDMIIKKQINIKRYNKEIITDINNIIGKTSVKQIKKDSIIAINDISSNEIVFNYLENTKYKNDISKPFLSYKNILYYYTLNNQSLEVTYHNTKYEIGDIIRLNVLTLNDILSKSISKESINNGNVYKYNKFNIVLCTNNTLYITNNTNKNNYCN